MLQSPQGCGEPVVRLLVVSCSFFTSAMRCNWLILRWEVGHWTCSAFRSCQDSNTFNWSQLKHSDATARKPSGASRFDITLTDVSKNSTIIYHYYYTTTLLLTSRGDILVFQLDWEARSSVLQRHNFNSTSGPPWKSKIDLFRVAAWVPVCTWRAYVI